MSYIVKGILDRQLPWALVLFGVPLDTAIAMTTVERGISYGFSTVLGGIVVFLFGGLFYLLITRVPPRPGADRLGRTRDDEMRAHHRPFREEQVEPAETGNGKGMIT